MVNSGTNTISFFQGNGDGTFKSAVIYNVGNAPAAIVAATSATATESGSGGARSVSCRSSTFCRWRSGSGAMAAAGNNTFLLQNSDVFLDMLTDSGTNAMSDRQIASMMVADDSYAGSACSYTRLEAKLHEVFGMAVLPAGAPGPRGGAHPGRGVREARRRGADELPLHDDQSTHPAAGRPVRELVTDAGLGGLPATSRSRATWTSTSCGAVIDEVGADKGPRSCAWRPAPTSSAASPSRSRNLAGRARRLRRARHPVRAGRQPAGRTTCNSTSTREAACDGLSIREITRRIGRPLRHHVLLRPQAGLRARRRDLIRTQELYRKMRSLVPLYEGFLTYGGMSVREIEALTVGLDETMDEDMIARGRIFIAAMVEELDRRGVPVITPPGGLGCHVDAMRVPRPCAARPVPGGALGAASTSPAACAAWSAARCPRSASRTAARSSPTWSSCGSRMPRRVFTLSQVKYAVDRVSWLYENRHLVGGLEFTEEPEILRFFYGRLKPVSDWQEKLVAKFREDFGDSL